VPYTVQVDPVVAAVVFEVFLQREAAAQESDLRPGNVVFGE
jgi:hypothetical protein